MRSSKSEFHEIQYLTSESLESFAESYSKSFPELKLDLKSLVNLFRNKFQILHESSGHNIAAILTDQGVVAAGFGVLRSTYYQEDQSFIVGLACDVFTNTKFRRMGLFKQVSKLAIRREELARTDFLIGFPIREEVMPGHLAVGWKHIFDMPLWWGLPRLGWLRDVQVNPDLDSSMFIDQKGSIAIRISDDFLKWRFSYLNVNYYLISLSNSGDFAIVRKARLRKLPFTCIIFMQTSSLDNAQTLVNKIRCLALRLGTVGVLGCWNDSFANELFLQSTKLRKSFKFQKVIVRELNGFVCPKDESEYRLSWIDSDTL